MSIRSLESRTEVKIFDIENHCEATEREKLGKLGIVRFCNESCYIKLNIDGKTCPHDFIQKARERSVPVLLKGESPDTAEALCKENPDIIFICGGYFSKGYNVENTAKLMNACSNMYLNLSGVFTLCNYFLHELLKRTPHDRLLFGTAYPHANPAYKRATALWEMRDISKEDKENIMYNNAARLFGEEV